MSTEWSRGCGVTDVVGDMLEPIVGAEIAHQLPKAGAYTTDEEERRVRDVMDRAKIKRAKAAASENHQWTPEEMREMRRRFEPLPPPLPPFVPNEANLARLVEDRAYREAVFSRGQARKRINQLKTQAMERLIHLARIEAMPRVRFVCERDWYRGKGSYEIGFFWGKQRDPGLGMQIYRGCLVLHVTLPRLSIERRRAR